MKAKFEGLVWKKGTPTIIVQGVKGNQRPKGAIRGDNGSFVVAGEPAHLYLYVRSSKGKTYKEDIYHKVMNQTNRQRMSQKLFDHIYEVFQTADFTVDSYSEEISWTCKL